MVVPDRPQIFHIVHVDRLASIVTDQVLWCDAIIVERQKAGTTIGMHDLKTRRLRLPLSSHPGLMVGGCVPFYFCPRSVMLYLLYRGNHANLSYKGGEQPIVHLEADMKEVVEWAERQNRRWAFTLSNAASNYFDDRCSIAELGSINWDAIFSTSWSLPAIKEAKQAEFLLERSFPWRLVRRIGVYSNEIAHKVSQAMGVAKHRPLIEIKRKDWYYG